MVELTLAGWEGRGAAAGEQLRQHVAGAQADAARAGKRRPPAGSAPGKFLKLQRLWMEAAHCSAPRAGVLREEGWKLQRVRVDLGL